MSVLTDGTAAADRRGIAKVQRPKVVNQYLRARAMRDLLVAESTYPDPAWLLRLAVQLSTQDWAMVAVRAGLDTPPSGDTVSLTIELLRERVEQ